METEQFPFPTGVGMNSGEQMQEMNFNLADLVSVPEAAKYLGVARKVVYQLIDFGELKAIRQAGKIWLDPCSLKDCRDKGKVT